MIAYQIPDVTWMNTDQEHRQAIDSFAVQWLHNQSSEDVLELYCYWQKRHESRLKRNDTGDTTLKIWVILSACHRVLDSRNYQPDREAHHFDCAS